MRFFTRPFALLIALAWIAAWATVLALLWRPDNEARVEFSDFNAVTDVDSSGAARVLASLAALALAALAIPVLLAAFQRSPRSVKGEAAPHEGNDSNASGHEVRDRVPSTVPEAEAPASLRPSSAAPAGGGPLTRVSTADLRAIQARLDGHDEEIRRLRAEMPRRGTSVVTPPPTPTPEREAALPPSARG
jgi:hypothetical protein